MGRRKCSHRGYHPMPRQGGTVLRVHIPAGAVINLLNFVEVSSPHGISLIVRIPFLGGTMGFNNFVDSIQRAGGTVEPISGVGYEYMDYYQPYY